MLCGAKVVNAESENKKTCIIFPLERGRSAFLASEIEYISIRAENGFCKVIHGDAVVGLFIYTFAVADEQHLGRLMHYGKVLGYFVG